MQDQGTVITQAMQALRVGVCSYHDFGFGQEDSGTDFDFCTVVTRRRRVRLLCSRRGEDLQFLIGMRWQNARRCYNCERAAMMIRTGSS
jgi:hypothetical protein